MTPHEKITAAVALILLLAGGIGFAYHWWVRDIRDWFRRTPADLPGPDPSMPAPGAGELHPDQFDILVRDDPEAAARTLIAEWHAEAGELVVTGDVWDQWWNGVDGLERECLLVHDDYMRFYDTEAAHLAECGISDERIREMCAA